MQLKSTPMKIMQIISDPVLQVITFGTILVGSPYFGGPYMFYLVNASKEGLLFAIIGIFAIIVTLSSPLFKSKGFVQLLSLIFMYFSLAVFFISGNFKNAYSFKDLIPLLSLIAFIVVSIAVVRKVVIKK